MISVIIFQPQDVLQSSSFLKNGRMLVQPFRGPNITKNMLKKVVASKRVVLISCPTVYRPHLLMK